MSPPRLLYYALIPLITALAVLVVEAIFHFPPFGVDDANIFFVYAKHLSDGYGFVYNIGGERVEGFTSLLWTLICALAFRLSPHPEPTLLCVNAALVALGATAATSFIRRSSLASTPEREQPRSGWPAAYLILLFTTPAYITWTTITLMDNALWSTLLLLMTLLVIGDDLSPKRLNCLGAPLCFCLVLARPESLLWVPCFVAVVVVRYAGTRGIQKALIAVLPLLVTFATTMLGLTIFRMIYFGFPLPNTYYAKVAPSLSYNVLEGSKYLVKYVASDPVTSVAILAIMVSCVTAIIDSFVRKRPFDGHLHFLPFIGLIGLVPPLLTGGDHFGSFRLYQSVYPIFLLCLLCWVRDVLPQFVLMTWRPAAGWRRRSMLVLALASWFCLVRGVEVLAFNERSGIGIEFSIASYGRATGELLRDTFSGLPEWPSVGMITVGGVKRAYPGHIVDFMGLNNTRMAHNKGSRKGTKNHAAFEKATFYELKPTIVVPRIVSKSERSYRRDRPGISFENETLKRLFDDKEFRDLYSYATISRDEMQSQKAVSAWVLKGFLAYLERTGAFLVETHEYAGHSGDHLAGAADGPGQRAASGRKA